MDIVKLTEQDNSQRYLADMPTGEIQMRLNIVTSVLLEAQRNGDARWKNLIPQQRKLNGALVARKKRARVMRGEPEITPTVVGMQPVKLTAKSKGL